MDLRTGDQGSAGTSTSDNQKFVEFCTFCIHSVSNGQLNFFKISTGMTAYYMARGTSYQNFVPHG